MYQTTAGTRPRAHVSTFPMLVLLVAAHAGDTEKDACSGAIISSDDYVVTSFGGTDVDSEVAEDVGKPMSVTTCIARGFLPRF